MSKQQIQSYFDQVKAAGNKLFIPYIMAGDGGLDILNDRIDFLEKAGVAAVELGIPFSDPVADGDTIQKAGIRALKDGVTLEKVLQTIAHKKTTRQVPIILMTYINPIFKLGIENFVDKCQHAGVSGVIIPDVPMEEEDLLAGALAAGDIAFVRLAAMTSPKERLKKIAAQSEVFLYAVAVTGTTGERATHQDRVYDYLKGLREYSNVPVLAGFGVSTPEQAQKLGEFCDGVIVGSKIVDAFYKGKSEEVFDLIQQSIKKEPMHL